MQMPLREIAPNVFMPMLGFGTYELTGQVCYDATLHALEVGYRHIDTAERYANHDILGHVLKKATVPREELFISSKVWWDHLLPKEVERSCERALQELGVSYLDLLMVHWPNRTVDAGETFGALQALQQAGKIRAFGVSNFTARHLRDLEAIGIIPANNQIEVHPSFFQVDLLQFCTEKGISVTAHTPFGAGADLSLSELQSMARGKNVDVAQIILAWLRQQGIAAVAGASRFDNIERNLQSLELVLTDEDIAHINATQQKPRIVDRPYADFAYV